VSKKIRDSESGSLDIANSQGRQTSSEKRDEHNL